MNDSAVMPGLGASTPHSPLSMGTLMCRHVLFNPGLGKITFDTVVYSNPSGLMGVMQEHSLLSWYLLVS